MTYPAAAFLTYTHTYILTCIRSFIVDFAFTDYFAAVKFKKQKISAKKIKKNRQQKITHAKDTHERENTIHVLSHSVSVVMLDQLYHEGHQIVTGDFTNLNVFAYNGRSSPKWKGQCRKNCGGRTHICMLSNSCCKKMKFGFIFENVESKIKTEF